jgi:regulator of sirC expression with transglutaminase-like and TPR domain
LPGEWNRLRIQVGKDRVRCYVNGALVFEHDLSELPGRRVGMAKFRQTAAEFKQFTAAERVDEASLSTELIASIEKLRGKLVASDVNDERLKPLVKAGTAAVEPLREQARKIEREAQELRKLASALERRAAVDELTTLLKQDEARVDLLRAALVVAKLDNSEIDVDAYCDEVDRMADEIRKQLKKSADDEAKVAALNKYLFTDNGYHGSRRDYYSRSNSYLNEVIDDREGLPITLSVLYIEVGRRLGLKLEGIGLPGHFLAGLVDKEGEIRFLDPFDGGTKLTEADAVVRSREITGHAPTSAQLQPTTKKAIVLRMLENLLGLANDDGETGRPRMLGYLDAILAVAPDNLERRMMRTMVHYREGRFDDALSDIDYLLDHHREQLDEEKVLELRARLERERDR